MNIRKGENTRESWWVRNLTNNTITIGDLLLVPAIKPGKRIDVLHHYSREKVGHSKVLVKLVKAGIVSFDKDKIYSNEFPGPIPASKIDISMNVPRGTEVITDYRTNYTVNFYITHGTALIPKDSLK